MNNKLDGAGFQSQQFFVDNIDWSDHKNCLEMFCGHGYIGDSLFKTGIVSSVSYADINPEAINYCKNEYPDSMSYLSDCFDGVDGKYDLIVGNPPWYLNMPYTYIYQTAKSDITPLKVIDDNWNIHRKFLNQVSNHLTDDGIVILIESAFGSNEKIFGSMAEDNNLELYNHHYAGTIYNTEPTYFCYYRKK